MGWVVSLVREGGGEGGRGGIQNIRSTTALQSVVESSFDNAIIPFAVPFLRKSASLTLFINASCITFSSGSNLTSCSSGQSEKWTISRHGKSALPCCSPPSSSPCTSSSVSFLCRVRA